jgi:hypothetical protein
MARIRQRKHKCLCCKAWFDPDPRRRGQQSYCSKKQCQKASKAASQRRWLHKAENEQYFHGPEHVERVRRWRQGHLRYWRKKNVNGTRALQDLIDTQLVEKTNKSVNVDRPLQDVMGKFPSPLQLYQRGQIGLRQEVQRANQADSTECR